MPSRFRDEGTGNSSEGIHAKNRPNSYRNGGEAKVRFRDVPKLDEGLGEIRAGRRDASTSTRAAADWRWVSGLNPAFLMM
jgi:hypothetical protein